MIILKEIGFLVSVLFASFGLGILIGIVILGVRLINGWIK